LDNFKVDDMFDDQLSEALADLLQKSKHQIVFAESCTAGLISASLARIPGASNVLAGSAVVYQLPTKCAWLNVEEQSLEEFGAVSEQVSQEMAMGAILRTPQATIAASVTGHLGPDAPPELDGMAWSTVVIGSDSDVTVYSRQLKLQPSPQDVDAGSLNAVTVRRDRQFSAVHEVMRFCVEVLTAGSE
jgi:nicotinamide-nucleotide amidase